LKKALLEERNYFYFMEILRVSEMTPKLQLFDKSFETDAIIGWIKIIAGMTFHINTS